MSGFWPRATRGPRCQCSCGCGVAIRSAQSRRTHMCSACRVVRKPHVNGRRERAD